MKIKPCNFMCIFTAWVHIIYCMYFYCYIYCYYIVKYILECNEIKRTVALLSWC